MESFSASRWAQADFARQYRENADIYIVERQRMLEIMRSFYRNFMGIGKGHAILDLGCGDGIVAHNLLTIDYTASATMLDPSDNMLARARERLKDRSAVCFIGSSFEELLEKGTLPGQGFDFIVSSQAIHHLTMADKMRLFALIYELLQPGGCFLNIDVILGRTEALEDWYMKLWEEWMNVKIALLGKRDVSFQDVVKRYKEGDDNKPDTLEDQLRCLSEIGFNDVDCFYKYGIFTVYGGRKYEREVRKTGSAADLKKED